MLKSLAETQKAEQHMKLRRASYSLTGLGRRKLWLAPIMGLRIQSRLEDPKAGIEGRQKEACLYPVPAFPSIYLVILKQRK